MPAIQTQIEMRQVMKESYRKERTAKVRTSLIRIKEEKMSS